MLPNSIVSGVFSLLGVVLGFFLKQLSDRYSERARAKKEFLEVKSWISLVTVANEYSSRLKELKSFFVRNPGFLQVPENKYFFQEWLMPNDYISAGYQWRREEVEEMLEDLYDTACPQMKMIRIIKSLIWQMK